MLDLLAQFLVPTTRSWSLEVGLRVPRGRVLQQSCTAVLDHVRVAPFLRGSKPRAVLSSDVYTHEVHRAIKHIVEWGYLFGSHHDPARVGDRAG